jgi:hypothetical protein
MKVAHMSSKQRSRFCDIWEIIEPVLKEMKMFPMGLLLRLALMIIIASGKKAYKEICGL